MYIGSSLLHNDTSTVYFHINRYPNTFGMFVAPNHYVKTLFTLMQLNNWRQVVVFYEETDPFFSRDYLTNNGSFLLLPVSATYIPVDRLSRESDLRIAYVFAGTGISNQLLCLAYHNGMVFPDYQFIFINKTQSEFVGIDFMYNGQPFSCGNNTGLDGHLLLTPKVVHQEDNILREETVPSGSDVGHYPISGVYDGVWSLALRLNNSIQIIENQNLTLLDYHYGRPQITEIIRNQIYQLDFQSASGRIHFNSMTGYISRIIEIHQLVGGTSSNIAYYKAGELFNISNEIVFIQDRFELTQVSASPALAIIFIVLTSIIAILIIIAHILTCIYRNKRQIKASSPVLSHFIFLGCYALIISGYNFIIVSAFPPASNSLAGAATCNLFIWLGSFSYSLIFGTLCAKTWRLYRIFTSAAHFRKAGKQLKDFGSVIFVLTLLTLNVIALVLFTALATPVLLSSIVPNSEEQKTSIQLICTAGSTALNNLWYVMLIGYQALLAFLMALIAILAHYVLHKNFQKPNALIILDYFVAVDYGLGLPAIIVSGFSSSISVDVVFSLWCLVGTVLLLLCFVFLFLPPLYKLYNGYIQH